MIELKIKEFIGLALLANVAVMTIGVALAAVSMPALPFLGVAFGLLTLAASIFLMLWVRFKTQENNDK